MSEKTQAVIGEIEKGVEFVGSVAGRNGVWKQALGEMEVGDSRLVEGVSDKTLQAAVFRTQKALRILDDEVKFRFKAEGEGYRVWRVA